MDHWSGVDPVEIAEYMGYNAGTAFIALWRGELKAALSSLQRLDNQRYPVPRVEGIHFREIMQGKRLIFNRPSPWCESVRYAMAALCDLCSNPDIKEASRLCARAIMCVKTAIQDDECLGRGLEP